MEPDPSCLSDYFKYICYKSNDLRIENLKNFIDNFELNIELLDHYKYPNLFFIKYYGALYYVFFEL